MKKIAVILLSSIMVSCNFNSVNHNREEDKKAAEKIVNSFYNSINNNQNFFNLISDNLLKVTPKNEFIHILNTSRLECGEIKSYSLIHWETLVIGGTNPKSEYLLIYSVKRTKKNTNEKFTLKKENDSIKILGYNIEF